MPFSGNFLCNVKILLTLLFIFKAEKTYDVIDSQLIRQAFDSVIVTFGQSVAKTITEDLRHNDVYLNDMHLTLEKLANGLQFVLGDETGTLLVQYVLLEIDRLCTPTIRT
jgi:hypothetical protein